MNKIYDYVLLGYTSESVTLLKSIKQEFPEKAGCIVARTAPKLNTFDLTVFQLDMVYLNFFRGLIAITSKENITIYTTRLFLNIGTIPKKLPWNWSGIYYNFDNFYEKDKNAQCIILGESKLATRAAVKLAPRFKYIYLCPEGMTVDTTAKVQEKLKALKNVMILPNSKITKIKADVERPQISEIQFSTYTMIHAKYIIAFTERTPDTSWLTAPLISLNPNTKKIKVNTFGQTEPIANIFAYGNCAETVQGNKVNIKNLINYLKEDLIWNSSKK